jgi:hypothetical protein
MRRPAPCSCLTRTAMEHGDDAETVSTGAQAS